ncbi:terpene synthase family protein [Streptomyces cyaneofuscatus]|uniref:terpene synthase family protein n=1 Tax=Streptomyces cyaneofuscatus TaxID=66883 RepID=UPI0037B146DB
MTGALSGLAETVQAVVFWARCHGLVAGHEEERRLVSMRLELLADGALPKTSDAADVALTGQWAAFICWMDDRIDRQGLGSRVDELERFCSPLREVLVSGAPAAGGADVLQARALASLWGRTAPGMPQAWRARFTADYLGFLDATEEEAALRRSGAVLSLDSYLRLRRRTITVLPLLDVLERTVGTLMPDIPQLREQLTELRWAVADVAGWVNDLASAADDRTAAQENLVTVLAREHRWSANEARARAAEMVDVRRAEFHALADHLRVIPALSGERREALCRYVDLVERFLDATLHWLATTGRFTPAGPGGWDVHRRQARPEN